MPLYDKLAGPKGDDARIPTPRELDTESLSRRCMGYLAISDKDEGRRLRGDRIGARMWYGHQWSVPVPEGRAAIIDNKSFALVHHRVSIETKQDPVPVIYSDESGDNDGARIMRQLIMRLWREQDMRVKLREARTLSITTRTAAFKVVWDPTLRGGAGDIATDVIPGWKLLLDNRCRDKDRMQFCGHRERMTRTRAMLLYPKAADLIEAGAHAFSGNNIFHGTTTSFSLPITDPWNTGLDLSAGATTVNSKGVLLTQASSGPDLVSAGAEFDQPVEIIELYHRDPTQLKRRSAIRDELGRIKRAPRLGPDGQPVLLPGPDEHVFVPEMQTYIAMPQVDYDWIEQYEDLLEYKYPFYRRTTLLMPDGLVLDDRAWDGPLPYSFFQDVIALDGMWTRGSIFQLYYLQGMLNVAISNLLDNLRMGSMQVFIAGSQAGINDDQIVTAPGKIIKANDQTAIVPLPVPQVSESWMKVIAQIEGLMEDVFGLKGVMQGESQGRVDTGQAYDMLAEIGGSRVVENTQRMTMALSDWAEIVMWYMQRYYSEKHAIHVEDAEGNVTWQRSWAQLLQGSYNCSIAEGSTMAWSESAQVARTMQLYQMGFIDKPEVYRRLNYPNWQEVVKRMLSEDPRLAGIGGMMPAPPKPPKQTQPKAPKPNGRMAGLPI